MKVESVGANRYVFDFGGGTAETIVEAVLRPYVF
jgi:hypothetical protein